MFIKTFLASAMALIATAATAQGTAVGSTPNAACELHVWPAERFNAMTTGLLGGFDALLNADKDKGNRTKMAAALDPQGQLDALTSLDLVVSLKLPPSKIVVHAEALDRKTINKIDTRRAQSASACYSELITADVFYQKATLYGRSLRTLFLVRRFGAAQSKPVIYKAWGGNGLKLFPAKQGEDVQAADAELVSVFKANFEEFARNASKKVVASR